MTTMRRLMDELRNRTWRPGDGFFLQGVCKAILMLAAVYCVGWWRFARYGTTAIAAYQACVSSTLFVVLYGLVEKSRKSNSPNRATNSRRDHEFG